MDYVYSFSASPNKTNFTVGDITVASKKGWEYLWVEYAVLRGRLEQFNFCCSGIRTMQTTRRHLVT